MLNWSPWGNGDAERRRECSRASGQAGVSTSSSHIGINEQSERSARKQFQPYLDTVNDATPKLPPRIGLTLAEFVEDWRTNVAVNLKGSSTRAAESHLRAHIIPKLGDYHLPEITTKIVQIFVAYLAGGGRSRKTAENILLTLSSLLFSSLLKTARSWGYACGDFRFADLTLPREGVKAEPRSFLDDEVRRHLRAKLVRNLPSAKILQFGDYGHSHWEDAEPRLADLFAGCPFWARARPSSFHQARYHHDRLQEALNLATKRRK